jgi:hypothetical protein
MGSWTEANIAAWQKEAGIEPATGEDLRAVGGFITQAAFELPDVEHLCQRLRETAD